MTETGLSLGTPHYMSPEQATGDGSVGPATDIYALGCVLYEMLVGDPPYTGSTPQAILGKILMAQPVSATVARKLVPPNVDAAIRKALEKLPADRFSSAQDFAKALGDPGFRHGAVATAGMGAGRGLWNPLSMAATAMALVLGAGLALSLVGSAPPLPVSRHVLSTEGLAGPNVRMGLFMAVAPDGSSLVVPVEAASGLQLGLKLRGSTEVTPIPGTEGASNVVFSPDAQSIAYRIGSDLFTRPIEGGSVARIADDTEAGTTTRLSASRGSTMGRSSTSD
jgi:serine/threonine-protein kinase